MKRIRALLHHRIVGTMGAALLAIGAVPAIVGLVLKALGLPHSNLLHTWPLDVGHNMGPLGAAGGAGAGAAAGAHRPLGPLPASPPNDKDPNPCAGLQRGYDQEKGILDNIDDQCQALATQYNNSLAQLAALQARFDALMPSVKTLILQNEANQLIAAFASFLSDIALEVFAPEMGIAEAAEAPTALFEGVKTIMEMVETIQGSKGTLEQVQEWAQNQGTGPDDPNVTNVLQLIGLGEQMEGLGQTMLGLKDQYDELQVERDAEAQRVADAKDELDDCLACG